MRTCIPEERNTKAKRFPRVQVLEKAGGMGPPLVLPHPTS